jgi:hypothetical protein
MRKIYVVLIGMALVLAISSCDTDGGGGGEDETPEGTWKWVQTSKPEGYSGISWPLNDNSLTIEKINDNTFKFTMHNAAPEWWRWTAMAGINYSANPGINEYKLELWTESGTRDINIRYYEKGEKRDQWDSPENGYMGMDITLGTTHKDITAIGAETDGRDDSIGVQCGDKTGSFYIKIVSITSRSGDFPLAGAYTDADTGDTITVSATGTYKIVDNNILNNVIVEEGTMAYTTSSGGIFDDHNLFLNTTKKRDWDNTDVLITNYGDGTSGVYTPSPPTIAAYERNFEKQP